MLHAASGVTPWASVRFARLAMMTVLSVRLAMYALGIMPVRRRIALRMAGSLASAAEASYCDAVTRANAMSKRTTPARQRPPERMARWGTCAAEPTGVLRHLLKGQRHTLDDGERAQAGTLVHDAAV